MPEADGGTDEFGNAIPLCFDCHAWAGHFFAGHPRGSAYSPSELRKARDDWFGKVERNEISSQVEERSPLHVRYFLCRDWEIAGALLKGDLELAPVRNPLLARTPASRAASEVISLQSGYRSALIDGDHFRSIQEYTAAHPQASIRTTHPYATNTGLGYAFYNCARQCSDREIRDRVLRRDPVSAFLAFNGAQLQELAIAVADNGDCGDGSIAESYRLRPVWFLFVAITNVSQDPIAVESIAGVIDQLQDFRRLDAVGAVGEWRLPPCEVANGQTILAPCAMLAAPLQELGEALTEAATIVDQGEYAQSTHLARFPDEGIEDVRVLGPRIRPKTILMRTGSSRVAQDVHDFDLENVYTIDRNWQCGSCPHLFFLSDNGYLQYGRELIQAGGKSLTNDAFNVPAGTAQVLIAELEDEVTHLVAVTRNGRKVCENVVLNRGQVLRFTVHGGEIFEVSGRYYSNELVVPRTQAAAMRNQLVCRFLRNWERSAVTG